MQTAIERLKDEGGEVLYGGEPSRRRRYPGGCYVTPCLATREADFKIVQEETFGPLLYLISYRDFDEAIAHPERRAAGTELGDFHQRRARGGKISERGGSDCGIANVNTGTSGAEIGGAFGGEKDTGGGRESGSDAGRITCAARRSRSIFPASCRWRRGFSSARARGARPSSWGALKFVSPLAQVRRPISRSAGHREAGPKEAVT